MERKLMVNVDFFIFFAILFLICVTLVFATEKGKIVYPTGYRDWFHIKSMLIFDQNLPFLIPLEGFITSMLTRKV